MLVTKLRHPTETHPYPLRWVRACYIEHHILEKALYQLVNTLEIGDLHSCIWR